MTLRRLDVCVLGLLAIGAAACSPSPGPEARGAMRVSPYSAGCGSGPYLIPSTGTITNEQTAGDRITDGKAGDVDCGVTQSGGGYHIHGELEQDRTSFTIDGIVVEDPANPGQYQTAGATGFGAFYAPSSGNIYSSTCTLTVLPHQDVATGRVWGNYRCTQSTKEGDAGGFSCNFEGSFIFENCN